MAAPDTISGLHVWSQASNLALANGAAVASWADSGPGGFTATQSTAGLRPTYVTNVINGLPVVRFTGGKRYLVSGASSSLTEETIFVVFNHGDRAIEVVRGTTGDGGIIFQIRSGVPAMNGQNTGIRRDSTTDTNATDFFIHCATHTTTATAFWVNGVAAGTGSGLTPTAGRTTVIGADPVEAAEYLDGDIAELIVYSRVLTAGERATVHSYLQDRYAITVADYVASDVTATDTLPAGTLVGSPAGESVQALSINVALDGSPPAGTFVVSPDGESISVTIPDTIPAWVIAGAASGESVGVSVLDPTLAGITVGSPFGELVTSDEPGLPAGGAPFVSLWAIDPDTDGLIHLPHALKVDLSPIRNTGGTFRFEYPAFGKNFEFLHHRMVDDKVAVELELWVGGSRFNALGGDVLQVEGDDVAEGSVWKFGGKFFTHRLSWATVRHDAAQEKGERRFSNATAGTIMRTFLQEAQSRGTLADLSFATFSTTHDSAKVPWSNTVSMKFTPYADGGLLTVLSRLVALGLCEGEVDRDKRFLLYNAGGAGRDLTTRNPPTMLRRAKDLLESNRRIDVGESGTDVYATGAEGLYASTFDATARARWDQQIEMVVDSNQIEDQAALNAFVQTSREQVVLAPMELTHGLVFGTSHPAPVSGFRINDWLYSDVGRGLERVRVAQWVLSQDVSGIQGSVTLNDIITDRLTQLQRRLAALADGSAVVGTSNPPQEEDTLAPAAPTGVSADSEAYQEGSDTVAVLIVGWNPVNTNSDGTATDDVAGYRVEYAYVADGDAWQLGQDVTGTAARFGSLTAGVDVRVRVRAYDRNGNTSAPSAAVELTTEIDNNAPPIPSAPVVTTRVTILAAAWNGRGSAGEEMPLDLDYVEVHVSAASNFIPTAATYYDRLGPGGGVMPITGRAFGAATFVRLVAVDKTTPTPNRSGPSAQGSATPQQVVNADIFDGAVGTSKLGLLVVKTANIDNAAVNAAQIGTVNAGSIQTGTLEALLTLSGIIRTGVSPNRRMEITSNGWSAYDTSNQLWAELNLATRSMLVTGTYLSGTSGERIRLDPDGSARWYGTSGTDYASIENDNAIVRFRSRAHSSGRRSYVNFNPDGFSCHYGPSPTSAISIFDLGLTYGVINAPVTGIRILRQFSPSDGTANRMHFLTANNSGDDGNSVVHFYGRRAGGGDRGNITDDIAVFRGAARGCGILFAQGNMQVVGASDSSFGNIVANEFLPPSSLTVKSRPQPVEHVIPAGPRAVLQQAPATSWYYLDDLQSRAPKPGTWIRRVDPDGTERMVEQDWLCPERPARLHFGPVAEQLAAVSEHLVARDPDGTVYTDLRDLIGVVWAAVADLDRDLSSRVGRLEHGRTLPVVVDGEAA